MAWGGSLNRDGSDYIRKLKKILHFLESFKKTLRDEEKAKVTDVIDIITKYSRDQFENE